MRPVSHPRRRTDLRVRAKQVGRPDLGVALSAPPWDEWVAELSPVDDDDTDSAGPDGLSGLWVWHYYGSLIDLYPLDYLDDRRQVQALPRGRPSSWVEAVNGAVSAWVDTPTDPTWIPLLNQDGLLTTGRALW